MTDLLPEYSRAFASLWEGFRSVTWDKWVWAAAPFAAALVQPLTRKFFPDWGDGAPLFTLAATRGASVGQHLWLKGTPLVMPLVVGAGLLTQSIILPSLALLAVGIGGAVCLSIGHHRARTQVTFCQNRFRHHGLTYRYSDISSVEETPEGTRLLRWNKFEVCLTTAQYEILRPCLLRQGYGSSETALDSRQWDLH